MIHVIGSINLDLIATVSRLPKPGETVAGDRFSSAPGGKGANQALAARRAGAAVTMTGAVGDDASFFANGSRRCSAASRSRASIRSRTMPRSASLRQPQATSRGK